MHLNPLSSFWGPPHLLIAIGVVVIRFLFAAFMGSSMTKSHSVGCVITILRLIGYRIMNLVKRIRKAFKADGP